MAKLPTEKKEEKKTTKENGTLKKGAVAAPYSMEYIRQNPVTSRRFLDAPLLKTPTVIVPTQKTSVPIPYVTNEQAMVWTNVPKGSRSVATVPKVEEKQPKRKAKTNHLTPLENANETDSFSAKQASVLSGINDKSQNALEELYKVNTEGIESATGYDKSKRYGAIATIKWKKQIEEDAKNALKEQGYDDFDSVYEYYSMNRDKEKTTQATEKAKEEYSNASTAGKVGKNLNTIFWNPVNGLKAISEFGKRTVNEDAPLNIYSDAYRDKNISDAVRESTQKEIAEKAGDKVATAYNIGMSIGDSTANLPLYALSPGLSALSLGANAATSTAKEATQRGIVKDKAVATGIASGVIEAATEKIPMDNLFRVAKTSGAQGLKGLLKTSAKQAGIEATEEMISQAANTIADNVINGADSNYELSVHAYMSQGKTYDEARKLATKNVLAQIGQAGIMGGISGGIMGAGAQAVNYGLNRASSLNPLENATVNETKKEPYRVSNASANAAPPPTSVNAHEIGSINTIPTLKNTVNEANKTPLQEHWEVVNSMSEAQIEQAKADLFKVTADIKRSVNNNINMYYKGGNGKELKDGIAKLIDDYSANPTEENLTRVMHGIDKVNGAMRGQKYTRKKSGITSVYDDNLVAEFNGYADSFVETAERYNRRNIADNVASNPTLTAEFKPRQEVPFVKAPNDGAGTQKISKVRSNTMQNSDIATEAELNNNFKQNDYAYNVKTEEQSLNRAKETVDTQDIDSIMRNGINQSEDIDVAMLSWSKLMEEARNLEKQGLDNTAVLNKANRLMRQVQKAGTASGQTVQAFAKWTRTPEGAMKATHDAVADKNRAKVGSKKYDSVMDVSDTVSDVFSSDMTYDEALQALKKAQADNPSVTGMEMMKQIVEECRRNNMPLTEESFNTIASNNPKLANIKQQKLTVEGNATVTAGDFVKAMNKVKGLSTATQKRIADILQQVGSFELNSPALQSAIDQINMEISKEFPMSKWDKFVEATHVAMLCNTRTMIKNTLANVALLPQQNIANKVSATMQNCYAKFNADFTPTQAVKVSKESKQLARARYMKERQGMTASKYSNESLSTDPLETIGNRVAFGMKGEINTLAKVPVLKQLAPVAKNALNKFAVKTTGDAIFNNLSVKKSVAENLRQFTYDLLQLGDMPFVQVNYVDRLASAIEAENKARAKRGMELIKSVDEIPDDFTQLAFNTAMQATFKDDNKLTEWFTATKRLPVVGEANVPFAKTGANIIMRTLDFSPVGAVTSLTKNVKAGNVSAGLDGLSRGLTGTGTAIMGVLLASTGVLIGSLSDDADEAAFQKQQGIQPFSISTKGIADLYKKMTGEDIDLGDTYITLDWAQPAASNLMVGAELYKTINAGENPFDADKIAETAWNCGKTWINVVFDNSTLSNIKDLFDTSHNQTFADNLADSVVEMPLRLVSSQLGALAKVEDIQQRQVFDNSSKANYLINQAMNKLPFAKSNLPQAYDTWGQEKVIAESKGQSAFNNLLNPSNTSVATITPIDSEIQRLYEATGNNAVFPRKAGWSVGDNKLTAEQYSAYQKGMGEVSYELAEQFINSESYKNMADADKADTLNKLYGFSKALYESETFGTNMSSENAKYAEMYEYGGVECLVEYMGYKNIINAKEISDSDKIRNIWNDKGEQGITEYQNIRNSCLKDTANGQSVDKGLLMQNLINSNMTEEEKGYWYRHIATQTDKDDTVFADWGYEGVYRYQIYKLEADMVDKKTGEKNGKLSRKEVVNYLATTNMSRQEKREWYNLLVPKDDIPKNPY